MIFSDTLRAKACEYELNALAYADRPGDAERRSADVFAAVAIVLHELAEMAEEEAET